MMMETKILMNLAPHPNICQIYGVTAAGSDAFLSRGKDGFYIILDKLSGTMAEKLELWRQQLQQEKQQMVKRKAISGQGDGGGGDDHHQTAIAMEQYRQLMQRLELALDVGSALLFLSDRQIVFHLRPEKIGFDVRHGRIKLCDFGQARENGQLDQAPSLTKTDDIRTLAYVAPEVLCQAPVTVAADVYAYGIVLWEMLSLERPFDRLSRSEHFEKVVINGERLPLAPVIPKAVQALIEKCWDPHLRPTMKKTYDSVEEILLFQHDTPELAIFADSNRPPLENARSLASLTRTSSTQQQAESGPAGAPVRVLRRAQTAEAPFSSKAKQDRLPPPPPPPEEPKRRRRPPKEEGTPKDRVSRKHRQHKTSASHDKSSTGGTRERMKDNKSRDNRGEPSVSRAESQASLKDKSKSRRGSGYGEASGMKDDSMKDRSKSRRDSGNGEPLGMKDDSQRLIRDKSKSRRERHGDFSDTKDDSHITTMKDRSRGRRSRKSRSGSIKHSAAGEPAPAPTTREQKQDPPPKLSAENEGKDDQVPQVNENHGVADGRKKKDDQTKQKLAVN